MKNRDEFKEMELWEHLQELRTRLVRSLAYVALGLVVGGAMAANSVIAVSLGGLIPLLIKGAGKDPALASSPILTTLTDVCGFFLVLHFATALLPRISG